MVYTHTHAKDMHTYTHIDEGGGVEHEREKGRPIIHYVTTLQQWIAQTHTHAHTQSMQ